MKIENILFEKFKNMLENPNFEQEYCSKTSDGMLKVGHDNIRLMKWLAFYDRSYFENIIS